MMKLYQAGGGAGAAGGMPDFGGQDAGASASTGASSGPTVEEVD